MRMDENQPSARREAHVHHVVTLIGGFLGLFPILNAAHLFGSSQTVNLIEIVLSLLGGNWRSLALHLLGMTLYCAAVFLVTFLPKHTKVNVQIASMAVDAAAVLVMWRLPENLPPTFYLYPTFFAMSFQWCSFKGAYGFVSATIFSTNNLRMFVSALTEVLCNGDRSFSLKARFFGMTLLCFHLGVAAGAVCWRLFGNAGFLLALAPICVAVTLILRNSRITKTGN